MKILIYGGGSVGLGLASCLLKSGADVVIIARADTVRALRDGGLGRGGIFGDYHAAPEEFACHENLDALGREPFDFVLVCVKSADSPVAADDLSKHASFWGPDAGIVLCQNGWSNAEIFRSFFAAERIYSARVITGFTRPRPNEVLVTVHAEAIHTGSLFGGDLLCLEPLAEAISAGDIPCEVTEDIEKDLWAKMLYNCALNPLGAIVDVPYGVLAEYEHTRRIMNEIVHEIYLVMEGAGFQTHWQKAADFLRIFYDKLVPATAEHKSSTLQDILAGKQTEMEALNGAVINLAADLGIDVPYNGCVYNLVKFIEARNVDKDRQ